MAIPQTTRLRYVCSKDPDRLTVYFAQIGIRVQIYDVASSGGKWFVWFVPPDNTEVDVISVDLDNL